MVAVWEGTLALNLPGIYRGLFWPCGRGRRQHEGVDLVHYALRFGLKICPVPDRLPDPLLVQSMGNLRAMKLHLMHARVGRGSPGMT
jgi:hypothetical protein